MKDKIEMPGKVSEDGSLQLEDRKLFAQLVKEKLAGKEVVISVARKTKQRTSPQNRHLWGVVYPMLLDGFIGVGYDINKADVELAHLWSKKEFLPPQKIERDNGDSLSIPASTAKLSTVDFIAYVDRIAQFAAEYLNIVIPPPNTDGWFPDKEA